MKKSESVFILLGGNQGDVKKTFEEVRASIQNHCHIKDSSAIYVTEPWGMETQELFHNQALEISTLLTPIELLAKFQETEQTYGRAKKVGATYVSRPIDIDILLWGSDIINEPNLVVPHPRMHLRNFTLVPLKEISPKTLHPVLQQTIQELLANNTDELKVTKA